MTRLLVLSCFLLACTAPVTRNEPLRPEQVECTSGSKRADKITKDCWLIWCQRRETP